MRMILIIMCGDRIDRVRVGVHCDTVWVMLWYGARWADGGDRWGSVCGLSRQMKNSIRF